MQSTADSDDVPSFFQLHGLFSAWPADYQKLVQDQPDLATQLRMLSTTPSTWEKEVYETLDLSMPETNTFLKSFCAMVRRHLPDQRQMLVSILGPHALHRGMQDLECLARDITEAFPNVLMSLEQLHHFEILMPSFHPGSTINSIGHFNLYSIPPLAKATSNGPWSIFHWDSIGTTQASTHSQSELNNMYDQACRPVCMSRG